MRWTWFTTVQKLWSAAQRRHMNIKDLLHGLADHIRNLVQSKGLVFSECIAGNFWGNFDPDAVTQIVLNLLDNAVKYTAAGWVKLNADQTDSTVREVQVAVSDSGSGIASEDMTKIFDRFYRVDSALSRRTQGAGLGLYLVKSVVEAHGGQIWVESNQGQGSTFVFTLPREPVVTDRDSPVSQVA